MMMLRLIPNVEMSLQLRAYYGITFLGLYVGNSGITSCILKVGDKDIQFKASDDDKTLLRVNGDAHETPTYRLLADNERILLDLPDNKTASIGEEGILLHHYLSYAVPTSNARA